MASPSASSAGFPRISPSTMTDVSATRMAAPRDPSADAASLARTASSLAMTTRSRYAPGRFAREDALVGIGHDDDERHPEAAEDLASARRSTAENERRFLRNGGGCGRHGALLRREATRTPPPADKSETANWRADRDSFPAHVGFVSWLDRVAFGRFDPRFRRARRPRDRLHRRPAHEHVHQRRHALGPRRPFPHSWPSGARKRSPRATSDSAS